MTERALVRLWLWKHPDNERVFSSTVIPGPRARQGLRQDGYKLYLIEARLPDEAFVPEHDAVLDATVTQEATPEVDMKLLVEEGTRVFLARPDGCGTFGTVVGCDDQGVHIKWGSSTSVGTFTRKEFLERLQSGRLHMLPGAGQ